jgi:hypothetical protein
VPDFRSCAQSISEISNRAETIGSMSGDLNCHMCHVVSQSPLFQPHVLSPRPIPARSRMCVSSLSLTRGRASSLGGLSLVRVHMCRYQTVTVKPLHCRDPNQIPIDLGSGHTAQGGGSGCGMRAVPAAPVTPVAVHRPKASGGRDWVSPRGPQASLGSFARSDDPPEANDAPFSREGVWSDSNV